MRRAIVAVAVLAMLVLAGCAARDAARDDDPAPGDDEGSDAPAMPIIDDASDLVAGGSGWVPVPAGHEGDVALVEGVVFDAVHGSLVSDVRVRVHCQDTLVIGSGDDTDGTGEGEASTGTEASGTTEADAVVESDTVDRLSPDGVSDDGTGVGAGTRSAGPLPPGLTVFTDEDGRFALPSAEHLGALASCPAWSYTAELESGDLRLVVPLVAPVPVEGTAHVVRLALDATGHA